MPIFHNRCVVTSGIHLNRQRRTDSLGPRREIQKKKNRHNCRNVSNVGIHFARHKLFFSASASFLSPCTLVRNSVVDQRFNCRSTFRMKSSTSFSQLVNNESNDARWYRGSINKRNLENIERHCGSWNKNKRWNAFPFRFTLAWVVDDWVYRRLFLR